MKKLRDLVSILVGMFGLIHSQLTGMVYPELVIAYTALLGLPAGVALMEYRREKKSGKDSTKEQ